MTACPLTPAVIEDSCVGPGGEPLDSEKHRAACLRADLCELASRISFQHGPRIVDLILSRYEITRKF